MSSYPVLFQSAGYLVAIRLSGKITVRYIPNKELFGIFSEYVSATLLPVKKKLNIPRIINLPPIKKNKDIHSSYNLPPITKLKSWMRRISCQWAGGKVHGLDIGFDGMVVASQRPLAP